MFVGCKKRSLNFFRIEVLVFLFLFVSWRNTDSDEALTWIHQCLTTSFDRSAELKLQKHELNITPSGFLRVKKTYVNGKQEYFSFNIKRFKDLDYYGSNLNGRLLLKTIDDDIIVQTFNDPKGNIDSMTNVLTIAVLNMEAERLDSLRNALLTMK